MKNPSAFPHAHLGISRGQLSHEDSHYEDGMTLRDYFAARAMQALITVDKYGNEQTASESYEIAEEMLKAREEQR